MLPVSLPTEHFAGLVQDPPLQRLLLGLVETGPMLNAKNREHLRRQGAAAN